MNCTMATNNNNQQKEEEASSHSSKKQEKIESRNVFSVVYARGQTLKNAAASLGFLEFKQGAGFYELDSKPESIGEKKAVIVLDAKSEIVEYTTAKKCTFYATRYKSKMSKGDVQLGYSLFVQSTSPSRSCPGRVLILKDEDLLPRYIEQVKNPDLVEQKQTPGKEEEEENKFNVKDFVYKPPGYQFSKQEAEKVVETSGDFASYDSHFAIGESKLGGCPDLPAKFDWPMYNEEACEFLLQLNLSYLKPFDYASRLPSDGMLYLFFPRNAGSSYTIPNGKVCCLVLLV